MENAVEIHLFGVEPKMGELAMEQHGRPKNCHCGSEVVMVCLFRARHLDNANNYGIEMVAACQHHAPQFMAIIQEAEAAEE